MKNNPAKLSKQDFFKNMKIYRDSKKRSKVKEQ